MSASFYSDLRNILNKLECGEIDKYEAYNSIRVHEDSPSLGRVLETSQHSESLAMLKKIPHSKVPLPRNEPQKNARGRPTNNEKRVRLIVLWAYATLHVPDNGVFRQNRYRLKLREFLDADNSKRLSECISIWNKFRKNDLLNSIQVLNRITIEEDGIERFANSLGDLRFMRPDTAEIAFTLWAREALSKYGKRS